MWDIGICGHFALSEMDEVHLTLEDTFFDTYTVDVRYTSVRLWCVMMAKR